MTWLDPLVTSSICYMLGFEALWAASFGVHLLEVKHGLPGISEAYECSVCWVIRTEVFRWSTWGSGAKNWAPLEKRVA